ncbi:MAG: hypothetical protein BEN18_10235 [Epulopiscium sp. Nuni2H_MBin001]|nr:MAG: hypothetical protein BEN18_10235 [Epulopiscium sp. Nuni2H_MBin001]
MTRTDYLNLYMPGGDDVYNIDEQNYNTAVLDNAIQLNATHAATATKHIPDGGKSGQLLTYNDGGAIWHTLLDDSATNNLNATWSANKLSNKFTAVEQLIQDSMGNIDIEHKANRQYLKFTDYLEPGWYRIATGNQCMLGTITIYERTPSRHQTLSFLVSSVHGTNSSNKITVLNCSTYTSAIPIQAIRIIEGGIYDSSYVEILWNSNANEQSRVNLQIEITNSFELTLNNMQDSTFVLPNGTIGSVAAEITLSHSKQAGIITTHDIYINDDKVLTAKNLSDNLSGIDIYPQDKVTLTSPYHITWQNCYLTNNTLYINCQIATLSNAFTQSADLTLLQLPDAYNKFTGALAICSQANLEGKDPGIVHNCRVYNGIISANLSNCFAYTVFINGVLVSRP